MGAGLIAMLACEEVSRLIASEALASAGWRRRLAVRLHLILCRHCRRYARQIRAIGEAARRIFGAGSLDSESHERLRSAILGRHPTRPAKDPDSRV